MNLSKKTLMQIINLIVIAFFLWQAPIVPGLMNTRRLSVIIALGVLLARWKYAKRLLSSITCRTFLWVMTLFVCYVIIFVNGIGLIKDPAYDYLVPYYMIWIFLYNFIFPLYCMVQFEDVKSFASLYIVIMLLESAVIYICVINTPFRLFIYHNFYGSRPVWDSVVANGSRIVGIYMAGSGGSLCFFAASLFLFYLYREKKIAYTAFLAGYVIILGATMFVGRLGFYLELGLLLYNFMMEKKNLRMVLNVICIMVLAASIYYLILSYINPNIARYLVSWTLEIFNKKRRFATIDAINAMKVPKLSAEMILGTNITFGVTPEGAQMFSDSGFAKMYCGMGVIGACIFYLGCFVLYVPFLIEAKKTKRYLWVLLLAILFVIEYKEPFFLKCTLNWQIMILMMLSKKEDMREKALKRKFADTDRRFGSKDEKSVLLY